MICYHLCNFVGLVWNSSSVTKDDLARSARCAAIVAGVVVASSFVKQKDKEEDKAWTQLTLIL